ncbi:MAG: secondary thiamine-phosphate synthase enzyme YjbQ [Eubacteriales bacterium]|nr:secondary thiamine-phosphate synthase enzyme YjbQ [Eubacteriales bacterium]
MKSFRKELHLKTGKRREIQNITGQVQEAVEESGIQEGMVLVNPMNVTSSIFINDDEEGLEKDFEILVEKLAPERPYSQYHHNVFEKNADAHLKRCIMGREAVCGLTKGRLDFGTWEQILYYDFDGKKDAKVLVKVIGE